MNITTPKCLAAALFVAISASLTQEPIVIDVSPIAQTVEHTEIGMAVQPTDSIPEPPPPEPEPEPEPEPIAVEYRYREDIPLDAEVQDHIYTLSEEKGIEPEIIFAMIWRESRYEVDAIGDSGRAWGAMQIHPRWHSDRMKRLGVETNDDLLDPIQNVTVGIDYLDELRRIYGDIAKALVAYNAGSYKGTITNYAKDVLAEAERLKQ